jgi:hypothetical protein
MRKLMASPLERKQSVSGCPTPKMYATLLSSCDEKNTVAINA